MNTAKGNAGRLEFRKIKTTNLKRVLNSHFYSCILAAYCLKERLILVDQ